MGKDLSINYFDVESKFGTSLILKANNVEIMRVEFGQLLPLKKAVVYEWLKNDDILTVISVDGKKEQQLFSKNGKILIMLKVDKNKKFCTEISDNLRRQENKAANFHDISDIDYFPAKILINDNNIDAIGIDLGTTRCCVAVNRTNGIETIALDNLGERLLPSYVAFDEEKEKCGKIVIDRLRYHAKCSVFDVKRIIGKHYEEIKVDNSWPFVIQTLLVIESKSKNLPKSEDDIVLKLKTSDKTLYKYPEEITSVLLKHIKTKAEEFQGKQLTETVITIPATFNEKQKQATYDAAVLAGWKTVYLLPEPVAAAFAYFIDRPIPSNSNFVLFDLGGGTLDVCVFKIKNNKLKIKSRSGDPDLGGRNFDNLLVKFFQEKLFLQYNVVIPEDKRFKLFLKCQNIKENLSSSMEQHFDAEEFDASINAFIPVSRDEFELMSIKILFQIRKAIEIALSKSNFMPTQIDKVLQVGGGCRMPMIKKLLKDVFHHAEICCETNPDEVVAIGAAYCAYYLNETDKTEYMYQEDESKCSIM